MDESIHEQNRMKRSKIERFGGRRFDAFDVYEFVIVNTFNGISKATTPRPCTDRDREWSRVTYSAL